MSMYARGMPVLRGSRRFARSSVLPALNQSRGVRPEFRKAGIVGSLLLAC